MKFAIFLASLIIFLVLWQLTYYPITDACSDYLLMNRTYKTCITDKRINE